MKVIQRLEFNNVFPEEDQQDVLFYLSKVSKETLLKTIGFCNTNPETNFDNFFSNPDLHEQIYNRVVAYSKKNNISNKPEVISKYASLKLAELILSNKAILNNKLTSIDDDELNLFKAFLAINSQLNGVQKLDNLEADNFEKLVDLSLVFKFPESDLALFDNDDWEFLKLVYSTIYKVEELFKFLNSNAEFEELKKQFLNSFNTDNEEDFLYQMKYLFGQLLSSKMAKSYVFKITDTTSSDFLKSITSENIQIDEDFTHLKDNPIYFLDKDLFSVVNYFFAIDKFYRSTKFKLKEIYETIEPIKKKYGNFFGFFNKHFSEDFLMKNLLDDIFDKKYYIKKPERENELDGEPDYYVRHNNTVLLFENKDVLIAKAIKSSANIEEINAVLRSKFVKDGKKVVGIGQLVNSIQEIQDKKFRFDEYVNFKNGLEIYPILIIQDRIFQSPGVNYRLNNWYREIVKNQLGEKYNPTNIKGLTVIDIDTLIVWIPYLKQKDKHFKEIINDHLYRMQTIKKVDTNNAQVAMYRANRNLTERISAISTRKIPFKMSTEALIEKFKNVLKE
ncbi:MAG: hypothetical protein QM535_02855 [Limnohabitans sp.]|nr:hypothetical protein [Limnohabitans sp.]